MSKHTPGPWRMEQGSMGRGIWAGESDLVASVEKPDRRGGEADGRLIAAAPELLATLKTLRDGYACDCGFTDCDAQLLIRDAIAKAEGAR